MNSSHLNQTPASPLQMPLSRRSLLGLIGLGAATAGMMTLTGCSSGGSSAAGSDTETQFTSWILGDDKQGPQIKQLLDSFGQSKSVTVSTNTYPYQQYMDQIVLKARNRDITGVAHIDEEWLSTLATAGVLQSVDGIFDSSKYSSAVNDSGVYKGTRYGMPWAYSAIGLVGNSEVLKEAGVDPNALTTPEGFLDALRAIKRADSSIVPYAPCTNVKQVKDIIPWMWAFGSSIVDGDQVTLGDDGSVKALDFWKQLLDEGLIQAGTLREETRTLFAQGKAAIYDDAPQAIGVIPKQSPDSGIADKMVPVARPGGDSLSWSQPVVLFDTGKASSQLAEFLSTDDGALQTAFEVSGQPPALESATQQPWIAQSAFYQRWNQETLPHARRNPLWAFPSASAAQTRLNEEVEAALSGAKSASAAMATAKDDLQGLLQG